MGPQLDSCGWHDEAAANRATMAGLQWGRNLTVADGYCRKVGLAPFGQLQWGRNLTVADGGSMRAAAAASGPLQWGRNLTVADGVGPAYDAAYRAGFNGAAT